MTRTRSRKVRNLYKDLAPCVKVPAAIVRQIPKEKFYPSKRNTKRCPSTNKSMYTFDQAESVARFMYKRRFSRKMQRVYLCQFCGSFHLTKQKLKK